MSAKLLIIVLLTVAYSMAQDNNQICSCDTEEDIKANKAFWDFLKKLSVKLDDIETDMKELFSVSPGNLYQFDCSHCEEKQRRKRAVLEAVEHSEEFVKETGVDNVKGVDRKKRTISFRDVRCPKGYARLDGHCIPRHQISDVGDLEYV